MNMMYPTIWFKCGVATMRTGDFASSITCFSTLLRLNPEFGEGWSNLAGILMKVGKMREAYEAARQSRAPKLVSKWIISELLRLLGEEKAIVSDIHGTTRDVIEDCVNLNGITFRFIDTAGIRQTRETIEIIGIERTYTKLKQASVVIFMLDAMRSDDFTAAIENLSSRFNAESQKLVIVLNKIDELEAALAAGAPVCGTAAPACAPAGETSGEGGSRADKGCADNGVAESPGNGGLSEAAAREIAAMVEKIKAFSSPMAPIAVLPLSAKKGEGLDRLVEVITDSQKDISLDSDAVLVTNARHFQALQSAKAALERVDEGLEAGTPTDLVAQDIREALYHIGTIAGEISTDEILGNIFGKFCIGK